MWYQNLRVSLSYLSLDYGPPWYGFVHYCKGSKAIHCWPFEIKINWGTPL